MPLEAARPRRLDLPPRLREPAVRDRRPVVALWVMGRARVPVRVPWCSLLLNKPGRVGEGVLRW